MVGVCDGFVGNRILAAFRQQAEFALEDGALPHEVDMAMEAFGFPMGPFAVSDLSGLDISHEKVDDATHIDLDEWEKEIQSYGEFFDSLGPAMPRALKLHRDLLLARIEAVKGGHG